MAFPNPPSLISSCFGSGGSRATARLPSPPEAATSKSAAITQPATKHGSPRCTGTTGDLSAITGPATDPLGQSAMDHMNNLTGTTSHAIPDPAQIRPPDSLPGSSTNSDGQIALLGVARRHPGGGVCGGLHGEARVPGRAPAGVRVPDRRGADVRDARP